MGISGEIESPRSMGVSSRLEFNAALNLADSSVNPKDHVIQRLYNKWRKETHGDRFE